MHVCECVYMCVCVFMNHRGKAHIVLAKVPLASLIGLEECRDGLGLADGNKPGLQLRSGLLRGVHVGIGERV